MELWKFTVTIYGYDHWEHYFEYFILSCVASCLTISGIWTLLGSHKGTGFHSLKWTVPSTQTRHEICNCKHTKSPPYCDGTHTNLPEIVLERQKNCQQKEKRHKDDCKLCTNCGWVPDF